MKDRQGFTLMELLVVLLIIGILSTVALRTIDATRNRSLFDQTSAEMNKLVQAIVGNPDLAYDGRRVDFGYYGDMEKLPDSLTDLIRNTSGSAVWRGPYFKLMAAGDSISYLNDGWGNLYTYRPHLAEIHSEGVNGLDMTVKVVDDMTQLNHNIISGSFLDRDGNPPGAASNAYSVRLIYSNREAHGGDTAAIVNPTPGGSYEISLTPDGGNHEVPIGIKKVKAIVPGKEEITRYVTIAPRSHSVVDFRFTKLFSSRLTLVGQPRVDVPPSGNGFIIQVANEGTDTVSINSLKFLSTSDAVYMRTYKIDIQPTQYVSGLGIGPGDSVNFTQVAIAPDMSQLVDIYLADFRIGLQPGDAAAPVAGRTFRLRFSDGSQIEFTVPVP